MEAHLSTENNGLNLPEDWVMTKIAEVIDLNPPKPPRDALPQDAEVTFVPMPAVDAQSGAITMPEGRPFASVSKGYTSFRDGDVIFAKITPCMENGKAAIARNMINGLGFGSTEFHVLRPREKVIPEYVYYYVRQESFRRAAEAEMTGSVGQKRVPTEFLKNVDFPLAPIAEQKRIVAKIEELLPKVNAVRERLIRVKEIMKRFRRSVLSAACSGRLTSKWREKHLYVTPTRDSINEILKARQKQWLEENSSGRRYRPPKRLKENSPYDVPDSWGNVCSDALFLFVTSGSRGWAKYYSESGPAFIRVGNLNHDTIALDLSRIQHVDPPGGAERQRTSVRAGDILISITADVGMIGLVPDGIGEAYVNQHVAISRPVDGVYRPFLAWYLASRRGGQAQFEDLQRGATKIGLGLDDIKSLEIPFPPIEEQREIVHRVESLFKIADNIENRVAVELSRTEKMTQAILAKAFRGELVPTEAELLHREEQIGSSSLMEQGESYKNGPVIYTIGHSVHSLEKLVSLLNRNRIEVLVDIRSEPYSRKVSHFNKDNLEREVRRSGLRYLFLGKELGGRPSKSQFYDEKGFVLYSKIAESPDFKTGLERVLKGIERFRVALMCSEENPANCHRHLLVGRVLSDRKVRILHIRGDGKIQSDDEIPNDPYQAQSGQSQQSLFVSEEPSEWKSTQSVLRRKAPSNSSAH